MFAADKKTTFNSTVDGARALDELDPLRRYRQEFYLPKKLAGKLPECVYLTGNSLGLQPKQSAQYIQDELTDWADLGLVLLLFGVGMEFGWNKIRQIGITALIIGGIVIAAYVDALN